MAKFTIINRTFEKIHNYDRKRKNGHIGHKTSGKIQPIKHKNRKSHRGFLFCTRSGT